MFMAWLLRQGPRSASNGRTMGVAIYEPIFCPSFSSAMALWNAYTLQRMDVDKIRAVMFRPCCFAMFQNTAGSSTCLNSPPKATRYHASESLHPPVPLVLDLGLAGRLL